MALPHRQTVPLVDGLKLPPAPLYVTNVDGWLMLKEIIDCLGEERPTHDGSFCQLCLSSFAAVGTHLFLQAGQ